MLLASPRREYPAGMRVAPFPRSLALLLMVISLVPQPLAAQHVLVAKDHGEMLLVCSANGNKPRVQKDGKIVLINPSGFALREVPEFLPVYVTVRNVNVRTTYVSTHAGSGELNNDFHFDAEFESSQLLNDVFVVLALDSERAGSTLFLWEVGTLEPRKTKGVSIIVPMNSPIGSGRYSVHLFSGGAEVMQSMLPIGESYAAVDRMVAARIKDVHDAPPKFFFGPAPEYPPQLKKTNLTGNAVVSVRIGANGAVFDPVVKSATDPAFGEAALGAVKLWRFLPRVKGDYPVETKADVPVVFSQAKPSPNNP
jgi:TonB family protein